jgi:hypothetical protein
MTEQLAKQIEGLSIQSEQPSDLIVGWNRAIKRAVAHARAEQPQVTVKPYHKTGLKDKDGREICAGDKIRILLNGKYTKTKYWNPEYIVVFKAPEFTLEHVGGGLHSSTSFFLFHRYPQTIETLSATDVAASPAHDPVIKPEHDVLKEAILAARTAEAAWIKGVTGALEKADDAIRDLPGPTDADAMVAKAVKAERTKVKAMADAAYRQGVADARHTVFAHFDWNSSTVRADLLLKIDHNCAECTIPGPTDADLDAAALARPKIKALVDAASEQLAYMDLCRDFGDLHRNLKAALTDLETKK